MRLTAEELDELLRGSKKLPWEDRLLHDNWKVRYDANIDLCDSITRHHHRILELGHLFKKTVSDSNVHVQDKALDALIAYLKAADAEAATRYAKDVCDAIVAKCFIGRRKTVEKAQMVFMLWVELEAVDVFLDAMEKAIKNKAAKVVLPAVDVMLQALSAFGSKIVPPQRILKMIPELFDHQDQNVRASSKGLTLELCRWIGRDPVKSILFERTSVTMKKELEAELANVTVAAKPTRKIRSVQHKEVTVDATSHPFEESEAENHLEVDEYEHIDPVDILTPLEKSGFWNGVRSIKWSQRKEAVAKLTKLASTKRIAPGDFTKLCYTLKKLIMDVNIAVEVEAVQAIGNLALGLRTHFSKSSHFLLPVLLEKLKKKKPILTEALTNTLQAIHKAGCVTLADIVKEVKEAVKSEVPHVCSLTLNWVSHCIDTSNKSVILKVHKDYVPICIECLDDGIPEVRDAALSVLAAILKSVGMRPLEKSLEKLDHVRRKKLSKMVGVSGNGTPTVPGSSFKHSHTKKGITKPTEMTIEEIKSRLTSLIQEDTINRVSSKERLKEIASFKEQVDALQEHDQLVEILVRLLCAVPEVVSHIDKLPKEFVILCIQGICERVADINTRTQAMECLATFAEAATPGFIFERMSKIIMNEHKNPKVLSGALLWTVSAVEDYDVSHLKLKDVIDFCVDTGLQSTDGATRNASRKLLGALHEFVAPEIYDLAFFCAIEAESENNSFEGSKQLEKLSLDDPQDENLDDEGTESDVLQTSFESFFGCYDDESFRQEIETMRRWKEVEDSNQRTRGILQHVCEPILGYPLPQHVDTVYGKGVEKKETLWTPYEPWKKFS